MANRILVSDKFDAQGIERLQSAGTLDIEYKGGHSREELLKSVASAEGLIIRSATTVDQEVLDAAPNLKLVVRAGVGVDNIDIPAASRQGVIVMNAPGGNTISTAEHAIALMMASARHVAQANASQDDPDHARPGKHRRAYMSGHQAAGAQLDGHDDKAADED